MRLAWTLISLCVFASSAGVAWATSLARAGEASAWVGLMLVQLPVAIGAGVAQHRKGLLRGRCRPDWGDLTRGVLAAVVLVSVVHVVVAAIRGSEAESWVARYYLQLGLPAHLRAHGTLVIAALLVSAVGDEIVWRGWVVDLLVERGQGEVRATVISAFLYAGSLLPTTWTLADPIAGPNPMIVSAFLVGGILWGGLARWTGRLVPAMVSHAAFSWALTLGFRPWGPDL